MNKHEITCLWCSGVFEINADEEFCDGDKTEIECPRCEACLLLKAEYSISNVYITSAECAANEKEHDWGEWRTAYSGDWEYRHCKRCTEGEERKIKSEEATK